eukprot:355782-Chlamydomonas_euryale.AAC.2
MFGEVFRVDAGCCPLIIADGGQEGRRTSTPSNIHAVQHPHHPIFTPFHIHTLTVKSDSLVTMLMPDPPHHHHHAPVAPSLHLFFHPPPPRLVRDPPQGVQLLQPQPRSTLFLPLPPHIRRTPPALAGLYEIDRKAFSFFSRKGPLDPDFLQLLSHVVLGTVLSKVRQTLRRTGWRGWR